jgi:hypothetical protein
MKQYVIRLKPESGYQDFVEAFNDGFCRQIGGEWSGRSLDAFHDYLSWPEEREYTLMFVGWNACRPMLAAEAVGDQSLIEVLEEIFKDNQHVKIKLE